MQAPGVILTNPKYPHNVAAAIRACSCFGITSLLWTGDRVDPSKYGRLPREERMKGYSEVEWHHTEKPFLADWRTNAGGNFSPIPICVEIHPGSISLSEFIHPEYALYVFGPEDGNVPQVYRRFCHLFVHVPARHCLNLAAALNVVLYDRSIKRGPVLSVVDTERRGEIPVPGWEGK